MKLLNGYLLHEHLPPFVVSLSGLTGVLLLGNVLKFAELVIAKGVNGFDLVRLLLYLMPYMLVFTIPMACLIAMVLAFGRLSTDYELIAMRASGIGPTQIIKPMIVVGLVISFLLLSLNNHLVPTSHLAFRRQLKAIGIKQPTAYLEAGTFIKEFPPYTIFVYQVRGKTLYDVRIYEPQKTGPTRTIVANRGEFSRLADKKGVELTLFDGTIDQWDAAKPGTFYKVGFSTYSLALRSDQADPELLGKKLKEMTFRELMDERVHLKQEGIDSLPVSLELHSKIACSFAPLVFILFGLAFGLRFHHHERLVTYIWVLAIFICYYLGIVGMSAVALKGLLPPWQAVWLPNLVGLVWSGSYVVQAARN